jgi:branched-chain amino acid transport system substrate-binding protein
MFYRTLCAAALAATSYSAAQADEFVIGLSGAITGPSAGSYAPAIDAMRIYFDRLNENGGIDGATVRLILQDDQGEASRGAANASRLISQDQVMLLINASLSSTYAPMIAETRRAGIPLLFASSVCPEDTYPPAQANLFCTTAFGANYDSRATLAYVEESAEEDVNLGLVAMAIPVSRSEIDYAETLAQEKGWTVVGKEVIPPPTADYMPFATNLNDGGANWVYAWAPWVTQVRTLEALRQLGWEGQYIAWSHLEAEGELARLEDENLHVIGANSLFAEGLPIHQEIEEAVTAAGSDYPFDQMAEGWIAGMVIEAALREAGPGASSEDLMAAMSNLSVDTQGLRGGPIEWTEDNHFRTTQYYRVYRWSGDDIEVVKDWHSYDVE